MLFLFTFIIVLILYFLVRYIKLCNYWKNRGVKYLHPLPLVGNSLQFLLENISLPDYIVNSYNAFPKERYCGIFQFEQPIFLLRDPELIKKVTTKEFDSFTDHSFIGEEIDSLWGKTLFASGGKKWKNLRHTLSPVFTSGRIKIMLQLIEQTTQQLIDYLNEQKREIVEVDLNDTVRKFALDAFASTAFGIENSNTLAEGDSEFYRMGIELTNWVGWRKFNLMFHNVHPILAKILNIRIISRRVGNFFSSIVKYNMDVRTKENIVRPDLIHLLMEARKGKLKYDETNEMNDFSTTKENYLHKLNKQFSMTDEDVYAQSIVFFFGGFDTVSNSINFCIYELVANMSIQEKLRNEVDENVEKCNGKITYEALFGMKYMDMVISETLRKWSIVLMDRETSKPFTVEPETEEESPVHLKPGDTCWIPIYAIHRDPEYWPNPDDFDPERFNEENRHKIRSGTYIPFGAGPRNCIGSRYALLIMKLMLFYVLANFEIVPTSKSRIPLVLSKSSFFLKSEHNFWFGFKNRNFKK